MQIMSDYQGTLFSHVAAMYRPGERDVAIEFCEALGCTTQDTGAVPAGGTGTFIAVHPNPDDPDPLNNVFYISEMLPEQIELEKELRASLAADKGLQQSVEAYRQMARTNPFGLPHFAINWPSMAALETVLDRLANDLRKELGDRVELLVFRPGDPGHIGGPQNLQAFLFTDIIVSGLFPFGQVIELQGRPRKFN